MEENASILIVDDDENICETLSLILGKKSYEIETAGTGQEALKKAQGRFFNVALLDIKLPDMEGVELIAPFRKLHPDMVMIIVTAYASLKTAMQALNEGASAYITKPVDMNEVLATVGEVLEKQRLIFENRRLYQEAQRELAERKRAEEELKGNFQKLLRIFDETVKVITSAVEMREPYLAGHQRRVTKLASTVANELGFPEDQMGGIRVAGLVHDIGMLSVPTEILSKSGQLTAIELNIIKTHPKVGYEILKTIEFPWPVAQIVYQHHERMNGSGYPQGLAGEDILPETRILSVADVVEAMSYPRPFRPPIGVKKAIEEISGNRGVLYDPEAVDACMKLLAEDWSLQFEEGNKEIGDEVKGLL